MSDHLDGQYDFREAVMQSEEERMRKASIIITLLLGALAPAYAQTAQPKTNQPAQHTARNASTRPVSAHQKYLTTPMDLGLMNLGPNFMGQDIKAVFDAIKNAPALKEKSEFETTADFEKRRAGFMEKPLYANLEPWSPMGFVVGEAILSDQKFEYDADSKTLTLTFTPSTDYLGSGLHQPPLHSIPVRTTRVGQRSYTGTNAFGAVVDVDSKSYVQYGILNHDTWLFSTGKYGNPERKYSVQMTPDEAKVLETAPKLLVICHLVSPWLREEAGWDDATLDVPIAVHTQYNYIQAIPEQLWIFNQKTGVVYAKLTASNIDNFDQGVPGTSPH